jgi:hypothetical protein
MASNPPNKGLKGIVVAIHALYIAPLVVGIVLFLIQTNLKAERDRSVPEVPISTTPFPMQPVSPVTNNNQPLKINLPVLWRDYLRNAFAVRQTYGNNRLLEVSGDLNSFSDVNLEGGDEHYALIVKEGEFLICEFDHRHGVVVPSLFSATIRGVLAEDGRYVNARTGQLVWGLHLAHSEIVDLRLQFWPMIVLIFVAAGLASLSIRWALKRIGLL